MFLYATQYKSIKEVDMVYFISKLIIYPFFRLFVKDIKGVDNLPSDGFIMAANHSSYIDSALLILFIAWHKNKKIYTFATNTTFTGVFWSIIFNHFGAIRIGNSLQKGLKKLKQGQPLLIFPEGSRTRTGQHAAQHKGVGVLALLSKKPVVPVYLNTFTWWNRYRTFPTFKRTIRIAIGKPAVYKTRPTASNYQKITAHIMSEVNKLAHA